MLSIILTTLLSIASLQPLESLILNRSSLLGHPMASDEAKVLAETLKTEHKGKVTIPIILAVIELESRYDQKAKSKKNCRGLMQISSNTATFIANKLGITDYNLYDIKDNIKIGVAYILHLLTLHKKLGIALTIYNQGYKNLGKISSYANKVISRSVDIKQKLR